MLYNPSSATNAPWLYYSYYRSMLTLSKVYYRTH